MKKSNKSSAIQIVPIYTDELKIQLQQSVQQFGEFSFNEDIWYCNKKHRDSAGKHKYTLKFEGIPLKYKDLVKYFALLNPNSISNIQRKIKGLMIFLDYIQLHFPKKSLIDTDKKVIAQYEEYLRENSVSLHVANEHYGAIQSFFTLLNEFPELPEFNPTKRKNPFVPKREEIKEKYIPKDVVAKWDGLMKDETKEIPLEIRTVYWLLRSFPNRVTEICSLEMDCLKAPYHFFTLSVPQFKQNGGYFEAEPKIYPLIYEGHGKYLIDLIKQMQKKNEEYFQYLDFKNENDKKYLLLTQAYGPYEKNEDGMLNLNSNKLMLKDDVGKTWVLTAGIVNRWFKKIAIAFDIRDTKGEVYAPTPHQFRHNAITDRLYAGSHTFEQVTQLSGHKGKNMPLQYAHQLKDVHKKMSDSMNELRTPDVAPVEVEGVIMNLDEKTVRRLEKNKRSYLTFEVNGKKGVGICSDIQGCNPKGTPYYFECYACDWFVPKAEFLEDYQKEYDYWMKQIEEHSGNEKRAALLENAIRNANLLERIIEIINNGIEKHKEKLLEKLKQGSV